MKTLRIGLAGLALAGMCQGAVAREVGCTDDRGIQKLSALEKKWDDMFNDGKQSKFIAERLADAAACRAFLDSRIELCKQVVRQKLDAATLDFYPSHVYTTDAGHRTEISGTEARGYFSVSCYTSEDGTLLRATRK